MPHTIEALDVNRVGGRWRADAGIYPIQVIVQLGPAYGGAKVRGLVHGSMTRRTPASHIARSARAAKPAHCSQQQIVGELVGIDGTVNWAAMDR
jgi:hypothetical protein